ncbi:MAG: encapsulin, partial [Acidimicrobiales bacterium]
MNHLLRGHAPITEAAWKEIDDEGSRQLVAALAARKLVEFTGPKGWNHSATNLGRTTDLSSAPADGLTAKQRTV